MPMNSEEMLSLLLLPTAAWIVPQSTLFVFALIWRAAEKLEYGETHIPICHHLELARRHQEIG